MSVEVSVLDPDDDADEWNRYVGRADGTNPFYRAEALRLQADDTGTTLHLQTGFVGEEAVGVFPVFEYSKGPLTSAFSPAPQSWSPYLGPAMLNVEKLKQRKAGRRVRQFVEGALERIDADISPLYSRYHAAEFEDVRPFVWNGFDVEPDYTYVVDLDGSEEELLSRFSRDARSNIDGADDDAYVIEEGDGEDAAKIAKHVARRYRSQGRPFGLEPEFVRSAHEMLPDGSVRPYVCREEGEFVGGILVVESERTLYRWQGGFKPDAGVDLPVNDLLDWRVMRDGLRRGLDRYDLVGAGVQRINRYKAKFNPRLETTFTIVSGSFGLDLLIGAYRKVR